MAVLQKCPDCHRRWSLKEKGPDGGKVSRDTCKCGYDLGSGRKNEKVRYYAVYWVKVDGKLKQVSEYAGTKYKKALASGGKRDSQKEENRILDVAPPYDETWEELGGKFLKFPDVVNQPSFPRINRSIKKFLKTFGDQKARDFKTQDLIDWQEALREEGYEPSTIQQNRAWVGKMVNKAADDDLIHPKVPRVFTKAKRVFNSKTKKAFKTGDNAKRRPLLVEEYVRLLDASPEHLKNVLEVAYNMPLRSTEPFALRWKHIDLREGLVRIPEGLVKKAPARDIPINHHVRAVLERFPRGLPDAPLFRYRGRPMKEWPRKSLENACGKAGILYGDDKTDGEQRGFCSRDIRPGVLSNMEAAGVGDKYQSYFAGHAQQGMDKHYFSPISTRREMDKFTAWLDAEIERAEKFVVKSIVKTENQAVADGTKTL